MFVIITIIVITIVAFNPSLSWLLAIMPGGYIAYATFITFSKAPELKQSLELTHAEKEAWKKYHAFLRASFAAPAMGRGLSIIGIISLIMGVVFIFQGNIFGGGLLLVFTAFIFLSPVISRLNPSAGVASQAQKGNPEAIRELDALKSLQEKLTSK